MPRLSSVVERRSGRAAAERRPGVRHAAGTGKELRRCLVCRPRSRSRLGGLDRYVAFDETTGLLRCEAGVSFANIVRTFVPRGWFLPTTPGTQFVTVGGAIAADVHGKNHHRVGSFGEHVVEFMLHLASGDAMRCARDENPELFFATLGGMGLTGFVVDATIRLIRIDTAYVTVDYRRSRCLDDSLEAFEQGDGSYEHSVA